MVVKRYELSATMENEASLLMQNAVIQRLVLVDGEGRTVWLIRGVGNGYYSGVQRRHPRPMFMKKQEDLNRFVRT